jgi:hypothetical protein
MLAAEIFESRPEIESGAGIKPSRGFVEQEHLGTDQEALGDFSATLKASGESLHEIVKTIRQVESLCGLGDSALELRSCQSIEGSATAEILKDGQFAVEARRLENNPKPRPDFGC